MLKKFIFKSLFSWIISAIFKKLFVVRIVVTNLFDLLIIISLNKTILQLKNKKKLLQVQLTPQDKAFHNVDIN